jgi:hypothetical protein
MILLTFTFMLQHRLFLICQQHQKQFDFTIKIKARKDESKEKAQSEEKKLHLLTLECDFASLHISTSSFS